MLELVGGDVDGDDLPCVAQQAPWTTASPTPPQPITATEAPSRTGVAQSAAPAPVEKPHASSVACSIGNSSGILIAVASCTTAWSANVPQRSTGRQHRAVHGSVHPPLRAELRGATARIAAPCTAGTRRTARATR